MLTFDPNFHSDGVLGCVLWADETVIGRVRFDIGSHTKGLATRIAPKSGREALLLGVLWSGLALCTLGAVAYDVANWFSI